MIEKNINISFEEYESVDELYAEDKVIAEAAIDALKGSYAPYSHFNVGAAVLLQDGTIVKGANQENSAYPSGLCAERTAMFAASANYPDQAMVSIAVVAAQNGKILSEPATPCGNCRQVMAQYQHKGGRNLSVIMVGADKVWKFARVDDVLPLIFNSLD